jgi:carboxypeptidase Taq
MSSDAYRQLSERAREVYLLRSVGAVLGWDFETYLPPKAVPYRADQLSYLEAKAHALFTEPSVGDWLNAAEQSGFEPASEEAANLRDWRRAYDRARKIPTSLVEEFEKARTVGRDAWVTARTESNFSHFEPHLEKIVALTRKKADLWGFQESPYDALIEDYEPGVTAAQIAPVLGDLRKALVDLLGQLADNAVGELYLDGHYPIEAQKAFSGEVAAAFGYDFASGRIDTTMHPFATTLGPFDQRTTRNGLKSRCMESCTRRDMLSMSKGCLPIAPDCPLATLFLLASTNPNPDSGKIMSAAQRSSGNTGTR